MPATIKNPNEYSDKVLIALGKALADKWLRPPYTIIDVTILKEIGSFFITNAFNFYNQKPFEMTLNQHVCNVIQQALSLQTSLKKSSQFFKVAPSKQQIVNVSQEITADMNQLAQKFEKYFLGLGENGFFTIATTAANTLNSLLVESKIRQMTEKDAYNETILTVLNQIDAEIHKEREREEARKSLSVRLLTPGDNVNTPLSPARYAASVIIQFIGDEKIIDENQAKTLIDSVRNCKNEEEIPQLLANETLITLTNYCQLVTSELQNAFYEYYKVFPKLNSEKIKQINEFFPSLPQAHDHVDQQMQW